MRNISMMFGKKKRRYQNDPQNKAQLRKKIWEDPSMIEDLFADKDWEAYDSSENTHDIPKAKMASYIQEEIDRDQARAIKSEHRRVRSLRSYRYAAAASILLLLSFSVWKWKYADRQTAQLVTTTQSPVAVPSEDSLWISIVNTAPKAKNIALPDQSKVKLFANSKIRYKRGFNAENREIYLDGKAYFSVQRDASRPFSVYAGDTKTTALGTSFTIDNGSTAKHTSVILHSGKVVVASRSDVPSFENVFLSSPGESLLFDAENRLVAHAREAKRTKAVEKAATNTINKHHILHLDNIPLDDVFATLGKTYSVTINYKHEPITTIQYTGVIDPQIDKLEDVLSVICLINDLRYVIEKDGSYSIHPAKNETETEQTN
ncbi:FecR domain-containing protein [Sphingobacterium oryzagri]|uniref:FecR domain-containing protein n=1 Tax=Sphingobacterium oryzagri TaxID=3025669 RepID=A0ABY7WCA6_9SPHI|nr:FecR domain-containing protein [Sphingobacterium sp. KACC 22765]WDF67297.1 FecR domain-containing protein [Sphingobacterium sp. KACC 22765]